MKHADALSGRADLAIYGNNSILLFALELRFGIEDIHTVATDSLTDGHDDKKCDLVYIDSDLGRAVIAQGYYSSDPTKREAPANKASDLNTAAGWLLRRNLEELPERIKPAATQLREALGNGLINSIEFWYVHNLPESTNVGNELKTVQATAHASLQQLLEGLETLPNVSSVEVGCNVLEEWYEGLTTPILVSDDIEIDVFEGYSISGSDWRAFVTAIPARWLHEAFNNYKDNLFSANIRGYLGSRKADANINNEMKATASNDPGHFWVYNNGLTMLTNNFTYDDERKKLSIKGISIVNGAQTTGAIGSLSHLPDETTVVPARFVCCQNTEVVRRIIQYNNSQNKIEATDFRSNDNVQRRLREEFEVIPDVVYTGGRRGGYEDRIRRPPNLLPSDTAGQALAAFHGDPLIAYNEKSRVWISDALYSRYFSDRTTAKHVVFAYSLLKTVEKYKQNLLDKNESDLTRKEKETLSFLRNRGATFLLSSAISASLETIVGRKIPDKFELSFSSGVSPSQALLIWEPIVRSSVAFAYKLSPAVEGGLNSAEKVQTVISDFVSFIEATSEQNSAIFSSFSNYLEKL